MLSIRIVYDLIKCDTSAEVHLLLQRRTCVLGREVGELEWPGKLGQGIVTPETRK
jgi:hypothetical protein